MSAIAQTISVRKPATFRDAARVQQSLLAPLERRCLKWLAERMPSWTTPDQLTVLGFATMLFAGAFYALAAQNPAALFAANVCLVLNWFGDSLDGTLARVRNRQRPRYGFYVDHVVDTFSALFLIGGLALSGLMSPWAAAGLLIAFYMLSINSYLATYTLGTFRLSFWKFSPTEIRVLLAAGNTLVFFRPTVFGGRWLFFDVAAGAAAVIMVAALLFSIARNTIALYRLERL